MLVETDEATLIQTCADRGRVVTADQLKRWRQKGLLQRPRQVHVQGRRGSRSVYPEEAVEQAMLVDELLRNRRRSFDDALIELWRRGSWVDRGPVRRALVRPLEQMGQAWSELLAQAHGDPSEAADLAVARFTLRDASSVTKLMVRRLGGPRSGARELQDVWFFFSLAFDGDQEGIEDEPGTPLEHAVATATGSQRARHDRVLDGRPWLVEVISATGVVHELKRAGALDVPGMASRLANASEVELDQARNDVLLFTDGLATIARGMEAMFGFDFAGLGSLVALASDSKEGFPFLIYTMLVLRHVLGDEPFEQIGKMVGENQERFAAIAAIEEAIPGMASALQQDASGVERLPAQKREELRARLEALFARDPRTRVGFRLTADVRVEERRLGHPRPRTAFGRSCKRRRIVVPMRAGTSEWLRLAAQRRSITTMSQ